LIASGTIISMMITFNKNYFGIAILIFTIEILIALFVRDNFIRPYIGDVLVVILIYCSIKSFYNPPVFTLAICVLAFAFTVEFLQYYNIVKKLGFQKSKIATTVIGTSFEWFDILAYMAGITIILMTEKYFSIKNASTEKNN
jgi:hypothetical protein